MTNSPPHDGRSSGPAQPLQGERQLRVDGEVGAAELLPAQVETVGATAMADDCRPAEACFERREVLDPNRPTEPAAAGLRARLHRMAERRRVDRRMVEHADHLDVDVVAQRQNEVACAEPRMQAAVMEARTERRAESLHA